MNILIELPTWLGDCVMATPSIENIIEQYPSSEITIFGSKSASGIFEYHPNITNIIIDQSKEAKNRYFWLYNQAKSLKFDAVFSFRRRFSAKFFAYFIHAENRYHYQRYNQKPKHQVLRYNDFVNHSLGTNFQAGKLKIYQPNPQKSKSKILGINPGASYGSAKRWYPDKFAQVINDIAHHFDEVIIFGSENEVDIAKDIVKNLTINNYQNLAGKTSITQLINYVAKLKLFISGDSGPMHLAAAFQIPTVAIFGPTKNDETSQWMNKKSVIVKQNFDCQPCMQRVCPLKGDKHHQCMQNIDAEEILNYAASIIS